MSEPRPHERLDLAGFVLGYLEGRGSIVTPPAFGVYEALMPDALAAELDVEPFQRFTLKPTKEEDTVQLGYGQPLVEAIVDRLVAQPGNTRVFINHVRPEKPGLAGLAQKKFVLPNARLSPEDKGKEQVALHHYLRFNFKLVFASDEKQEQLASVLMDVQGGHTVSDPEVLARLESFDTASAFDALPVAPPRWHGAGETLAPATFQALLPRAGAALHAASADRVQALVARTQRHLELDLARIKSYYDDLRRDLLRRGEGGDPDGPQRGRGIDDKLAALEVEHAAKLADVKSRYHVRIDLELVSVMLIAQPKLLIPVQIGNRTTTITRFAVWDPLAHRLEPLVCDACGQPGSGLYLCTGGHLAHRDCLAPRCIDCKRVYCQLCQEQVQECVVCQQPVCRKSLISCPVCGRETCREHQDLCHAAAGEPASLANIVQELGPEPVHAPPQTPVPDPAPPPPRKSPTPAPQRGAGKPAQPRPPSSPRFVKGVKINVEVFADRPEVNAFVMRSAKRTLAVRSFNLTPEGIAVTCDCEKYFCPVDHSLIRPESARATTSQLKGLLRELGREYEVPARRMQYYLIRRNDARESQVLILPAVWKDEALLHEAQEGYDREVSD